MRRLSIVPAAAVLAVTASLCVCPRVGFAAAAPSPSVDVIAQAWMGTMALLADNDDEHEREPGARRNHGDRCACGSDDCDDCRGGRGDHAHHAHRGHGGHGGHGPRPGMEGPRAALTKMDDIIARLARIEAKLDGRPVGPSRGEWRGPRPDMPEEARRMMEERIRKAREGMSEEERARMDERLQAMRERMREGGPRPGMPEEVREQMRKRMEEGREKMEQARRKFGEMEERIKKLEAEVERLKADQ